MPLEAQATVHWWFNLCGIGRASGKQLIEEYASGARVITSSSFSYLSIGKFCIGEHEAPTPHDAPSSEILYITGKCEIIDTYMSTGITND
jgi:hypothetical protein